jgi:hypothetical protein
MTRQTHLCPTHTSRQPSQPTCPACRHQQRLTIHDRRIRALEATIERLEAELVALESSSAGVLEAET